MIAYKYDLNTSEYVGEILVQKNPFDENEILLPNDCTLIKPPESKKGFVIKWNGSEWYYDEDVNTRAFQDACHQFKAICLEIGNNIGDPTFKGGFDEMYLFKQSSFANTLEGIKLAVFWSAANDLCVYTGKKIGLGQPEWWYECWKEPITE